MCFLFSYNLKNDEQNMSDLGFHSIFVFCIGAGAGLAPREANLPQRHAPGTKSYLLRLQL